MSKTVFSVGELYHIYNRGIEGRSLFVDEADRFRFLSGMKGFNNTKPIFNLQRYLAHKKGRACFDPEPIVDFVCYSLMPNHYHFIVRQVKDGGVSKFMQKLGTGYTMYFNKRYNRTGVLLQGAFKGKHITTDEYLLHSSRYIHLNALSLIQAEWIEEGVSDKGKALHFLKNYKWHSLGFWLENKPCLMKLDSGIVLNKFASKKDYEEFLKDWMIGQGSTSTSGWVADGCEMEKIVEKNKKYF